MQNLNEIQKQQLTNLVPVFLAKNSQINLSAIRDAVGVQTKHIDDSLLGCKHFDFPGKTILDLGSGGGFPAIPLAINFPKKQITALDSVGKKMKAVADMADKLEVKNLSTIHARIEDAGQNPDLRETFDCVTARALAPWPVLLEYALPFVKPGGYFFAYQGPAIRDELDSGIERKLGARIQNVSEDKLGDEERVFVQIKKIMPGPKKYPRAVGVPRNAPLK